MTIVTAGATDQTIYVYFVDDDGGTNPGEPTTGLAFDDIETGGSASYLRQGETRTDFALVTQTVAGAHTDGGFVEVDATNMPGVYRLDLLDAAVATGFDFTLVQLVAAVGNNTVMRPILIDLLRVDLRDVVRGGMTALPNAAAEAAGGLYTQGSGAGQINQDANGRIDVRVMNMNTGVLTAAAIAANAIEAAKINAGAFTAAKFAAGAIDAAALNADAVTKIRSIFSGTTSSSGTATTLIDASLTEADDVWNGTWVLFTSGAAINQVRLVVDFDAGTDTITFAPATTAAIGAADNFEILPAGSVDVQSWLAVVTAHVAPNALVSGRVDSSVGAMASDVITAAAIATAAIDADAIAANAITDVKIASAAITAAKFAAGAIDAAAIAADAITNAKIATDAIGSDEFAQAAADKVFGTGGATMAELPQGIPPITPRPDQFAMLWYMAMRNQFDVSTTTAEVHAADETVIAKKALTDDGSTYSEAEMVAGP